MSEATTRRPKLEVVSSEEFARRFRIALKDRNLTPYKAAKLMGVAKGYLVEGLPIPDSLMFQYARGDRKPGFDQLVQLVQTLHVNPRILIPELWEHTDESGETTL